MIWKLSIYVLLIALPAGVFTSIVDVKETRDELTKIIAENEEEKTDGAILGSVIAPHATIEIEGDNGVTQLRGTTNEKGEFFIKGFQEGVYDVTISAKKNNKVETYTFTQVEINIGEVTALGTVTF